RELPDSRRLSRVSRLCDSRFRRQYRILLVRHGPGPRLHSLRRLRGRSPASPSVAFCRALRKRLVWDLQPGQVLERAPWTLTTPRADRILAPVAAGRLSKGCGGGQSRIPRLVGPPSRTAASLLRVSQLLRCPRAVHPPRGHSAPLWDGPANAGGLHAP